MDKQIQVFKELTVTKKKKKNPISPGQMAAKFETLTKSAFSSTKMSYI